MADTTNGPDANVGYLLWRLTLRWRTQASAALRPYGLTHTEYVLLALLMWHSRDGATPTQQQLATHGGLEPMLVSKTVRALAEAGLVQRRDNPADRRAIQLILTDTGHATFHRAAAAVHTAHQEFLQPLGAHAASFTTYLHRLLS